MQDDGSGGARACICRRVLESGHTPRPRTETHLLPLASSEMIWCLPMSKAYFKSNKMKVTFIGHEVHREKWINLYSERMGTKRKKTVTTDG